MKKSERAALVRLATSLPKRSEERRAILRELRHDLVVGKAVSAVLKSHEGRVAGDGASLVRREMTEEVLRAFASAATPGRTRVAGLTQMIKKLWDAFQSAPKRWEDFKRLVGVRSTSWLGVVKELPGLIKKMVSDGKSYLSGLGTHLAKKIPVLGLYLDAGKKLPSVGDWLKTLTPYLPDGVRRAINTITTRANSLADWIDSLVREYRVIKPAATLVSAGLFAVIWFNVTEISWDVPEIIRGFLGGYSFVELLHSLPESGIGFVLGMMFPGLPGGLVWNAILPITVALRIGWMIGKKHIRYDRGRGLTIDWKSLGVQAPPGIPETVRV